MAPTTRSTLDIENSSGGSVENKLAGIHQILDTLVGRIENLGRSQQGGNNRGNSVGRMTRIEFARFNEDDVRDWVFRCEQFFLLDGIPDEQKYAPGHKCPGQLYSLVVLEEEEVEENLDELEVDLKTAKINEDSLGHLKFYIWNWPKRGRKGAKCRLKNRGWSCCVVLVHWSNISKEDATWESIEEIQRRFPEFNVLVNPCGYFWWVHPAMCARSTDHPWLIEKHQQSSSSNNGKCKESLKNEDLIMF
ncbi:reverse transcriptase [Tanacetum coccineum]